MVELTMPDLAAALRAVVRGLVGRLDTEQRRQLVVPFEGDMHKTSPVSDPDSDSAT